MHVISVEDDAVLQEVAKKASLYLDGGIRWENYYVFLRHGILSGKITVLVTEEKGKINSCCVLNIFTDTADRTCATVEFVWIDPHYPSLFKEYLRYVEEAGLHSVYITTHRDEKAFLRKYGPYGFTKKYTVFEKVM